MWLCVCIYAYFVKSYDVTKKCERKCLPNPKAKDKGIVRFDKFLKTEREGNGYTSTPHPTTMSHDALYPALVHPYGKPMWWLIS